jgi:hypothetical protein
MNGNAFRVMLEHANGHATGAGTAGKFDFWVVKNPNFTPTAKELAQVTSISQTDIAKDSNNYASTIKVGQCYRFKSLNEAKSFMLFSRSDSSMYAQKEESLRDSTFKAIAGQDETIPEGISFVSTSVTDRYLRHWGSDKVSLHSMDTQNIEKDSTFKVKSSLVSFKGIQIEASNEPNHFLVNQEGKIKL